MNFKNVISRSRRLLNGAVDTVHGALTGRRVMSGGNIDQSMNTIHKALNGPTEAEKETFKKMSKVFGSPTKPGAAPSGGGGGTPPVSPPASPVHGPAEGNYFNASNLDGRWTRAGVTGNAGVKNLNDSVDNKGGWAVARAIGGHVAKGAVAGGAIGGTMEAAQGGSFWTGAKEGAFNGGMMWGGYRTLGRMTGAGRNPLGKNGAFAQAYNMYKSTSNDVSVSRTAQHLLNQKSRANMAKAVTTQRGAINTDPLVF